MKNSEVTFGELRRLLVDLGFRESMEKTRLRFEHPSGPILLFHRYRDKERVGLRDMFVVRVELLDFGLMNESAFERFLQKTPA